MRIFATVLFRHQDRHLVHDLIRHLLPELAIYPLPICVQNKGFPHPDMEIRPFQVFDIFGKIFHSPMHHRDDWRPGVQPDQDNPGPAG